MERRLKRRSWASAHLSIVCAAESGMEDEGEEEKAEEEEEEEGTKEEKKEET